MQLNDIFHQTSNAPPKQRTKFLRFWMALCVVMMELCAGHVWRIALTYTKVHPCSVTLMLTISCHRTWSQPRGFNHIISISSRFTRVQIKTSLYSILYSILNPRVFFLMTCSSSWQHLVTQPPFISPCLPYSCIWIIGTLRHAVDSLTSAGTLRMNWCGCWDGVHSQPPACSDRPARPGVGKKKKAVINVGCD